MKLIKISDRFYFYHFEKRTDRPNLYYVKGDEFSVAIDAGNSSFHVKKFYASLKENDLPLPEYTLISHWHWDHTFGLKDVVGISISTQKTHDKLVEMMNWKWTLEDMKKREETGEDIPFCTENILREYEDLDDISVVTTQKIIDDDLKMDLGGISIEILPRVSTHSEGALYVYIPDEKALIVEDADCEDFYDNDYYDPDKLKEMMDFFESMDYEYHYLGHAERETKEFALDRLKNVLNDIS